MKQDDEREAGNAETTPIYPPPVPDPKDWLAQHQVEPSRPWYEDEPGPDEEIGGGRDRPYGPDNPHPVVNAGASVLAGIIVGSAALFFIFLIIWGIVKLLGAMF